jgi:regulator of replication initiation timing
MKENIFEIIKNLESSIEFLNQQLAFFKSMVGMENVSSNNDLSSQIDKMRQEIKQNIQSKLKESIPNHLPNIGMPNFDLFKEKKNGGIPNR